MNTFEVFFKLASDLLSVFHCSYLGFNLQLKQYKYIRKDKTFKKKRVEQPEYWAEE